MNIKKLSAGLTALVLATGLCDTVALGAVIAFAEGTPEIVINEICTSNMGENGNLTDATDETGAYTDWIELYNPTDETADLSGWGVSDKDTKPFKTTLPEGTTIEAGGYLVVYCCKTYTGDDSKLHVAINLSSDGETVTLTSADSAYTESVTAPALEADTTYARKLDGSADFHVVIPTPNGSNNDAESMSKAVLPEFSAETGMYSDAFDLSVSTSDNSKIYYTTDGTDPQTSKTRIEYSNTIRVVNRTSEANSISVAKGFGITASDITCFNKGEQFPSSKVDKCTVIKACSENSEGKYSETVTKSYFVGISNATYDNVAVLSVTTDPANLYDYNIGINVKGKVYDDWLKANGWADGSTPGNYNQKGSDWERACHIDLFDSDGTTLLSQDCGMRTQGAYSRADYQKSFRFYAREEYGEKNFKADIFSGLTKADGSGEELTKFKTFVVRNGGNDTDYAKFKDSYLQSLVSDRNLETQTGRACVVFIDGEYWGLYTLQEDYKDAYFENNYGVDKDEVIVYKKGEIDEGIEGEDEVYFDNMMTYVKSHDLSKDEAYSYVSTLIDIDSFIDYFATEVYIYNEDWPGNNYAMWRTRTIDDTNPYADGKWRMCLYDTEMGTNHYGSSTTKANADNLSSIMKNSWDNIPALFNKLIKNKEFKQKFVTAFMDIANVNFDYASTKEQLVSYKADYYNNLVKSYARFPSWANRSNACDPCLSNMDTFLKNRGTYATTMLKNNLGLSSYYDLTISTNDSEGGTVALNTTSPDLTKGTFTGTYFTDYEVTVSAQAKDGYVFAGWSGASSSTDSTISLRLTKNTALRALFTKVDGTYHTVTFTNGTVSTKDIVKDGQTASYDNVSFAKTGYTLAFNGSDKPITADCTFTAVYTPISYKVAFNKNGGTGSMTTKNCTYDVAFTAPSSSFTRTGYVFAGWSTKSNGSVEYAKGASVKNLTSVSGKTVTLYAIWHKNVSSCTISINSCAYTGSAVKPTVTIKDGTKTLTLNKDYTLSYENNVNAGKSARVTISGIGNYSGSASKTFTINGKSIATVSVSGLSSRVYRGTPIKATVVVKSGSKTLELNKDYTVAYNSNTAIGTAKIIITGKGNYAGTVTKTFKIIPKTPSISSLKSAVDAFRVSWTASSQVSGYRIEYSLNSNMSGMKTKYITSKSTDAYRIKGLTSGKKYYVRVRSYKTVNGVKIWSRTSEIMSVKVK